MKAPAQEHFFELTPGAILDLVEAELGGNLAGIRSTGRAIALNSLENRVYDIELENGEHVVTKFYRPGRWSREQIQEEHDFLHALLKAEIPAVAPLLLKSSATLAATPDGIHFAVFPKVRGRILDELDPGRLATLGRYLARIHSVGRSHPFRKRVELSVATYGEASLKFLLENQWIDGSYERPYREVCQRIFARIRPWLEPAAKISVHGDCHLGNTLWDGESPFFLDFDDAVRAPPVQDVWMIVRGRDEEAERDREILLDAYDTMGSFPRETLRLIEPLRALRLIHYSAWIARRWEDPSFPHAFPQFQTARYWQDEIVALEEICDLIENG